MEGQVGWIRAAGEREGGRANWIGSYLCGWKMERGQNRRTRSGNFGQTGGEYIISGFHLVLGI